MLIVLMQALENRLTVSRNLKRRLKITFALCALVPIGACDGGTETPSISSMSDGAWLACTGENTIEDLHPNLNEMLVSVEIPANSAWVDRGVVLSAEPGRWDTRIEGMFTLVGVIKRKGTFFLYYIGADGDRNDGGPANRAIGVATSKDGIHFRKYPGNPVLTHQPSGAPTGEGGIFSGGVWLDDDETVVMYFGGMEEYRAESVDGDIALAVSSDGLSFTYCGDVWTYEQSGIQVGDEIFPVAVYKGDDGTWSIYFIEMTRQFDIWRAWGNTRTSITHDQELDVHRDHHGSASVIRKSDEEIIFVGTELFKPNGKEQRAIQAWYVADEYDPSGVGVTPDSTHDVTLVGQSQGVVFLDRVTMTWHWYFLDRATQSTIRVRTASAETS